MKKIPQDGKAIDHDKERLEILTKDGHFSYKIGIFYELSINNKIVNVTYYKNGIAVDSKEYRF